LKYPENISNFNVLDLISFSRKKDILKERLGKQAVLIPYILDIVYNIAKDT